MHLSTSTSTTSPKDEEGILDQILLYMGKSCKHQDIHQTLVGGGLLSSSSNNNNSNIHNAGTGGTESSNPINNVNTLAAASMITANGRFMHLPRLETINAATPTIPSLLIRPIINHDDHNLSTSTLKSLGPSLDHDAGEVFSPRGTQPNMLLAHHDHPKDYGIINDWAALDRLVASQLNGQAAETSKQFSSSCYVDHDHDEDGGLCFSSFDHHDLDHLPNQARCGRLNQANNEAVFNSEMELWSFVRPSSSDPLCNLSV